MITPRLRWPKVLRSKWLPDRVAASLLLGVRGIQPVEQPFGDSVDHRWLFRLFSGDRYAFPRRELL